MCVKRAVERSNSRGLSKSRGRWCLHSARRCRGLGGAEIYSSSVPRDWHAWQWLTGVHGNYATNLPSPIENQKRVSRLFPPQKISSFLCYNLVPSKSPTEAASDRQSDISISLHRQAFISWLWNCLFAWIRLGEREREKPHKAGSFEVERTPRGEEKPSCFSCQSWILVPSR